MSRVPVVPGQQNLIHFIGDTHFGAILTARSNKVKADLLSGKAVPTPQLHVHVGDLCEDGSVGSQVTTALAWMNALDAPWITNLGNHDISNNTITPATAAANYGMATSSFYYDLSFARIIMLYPEPFWDLVGHAFAIWHSSATLTFLTNTLNSAPAGLPCLIVSHAPLSSTVAGAVEVGYDSTDVNFHVYGPNQTDDTQIRTILDAHTNASAWIYGHTHSVLEATNFLTTVNTGTRSIPHINCSSTHYTGTIGTGNADTDLRHKTFGQLYTMYMTVVPGKRLEVRYRDHGGGDWYGPAGARVTTYTIA